MAGLKSAISKIDSDDLVYLLDHVTLCYRDVKSSPFCSKNSTKAEFCLCITILPSLVVAAQLFLRTGRSLLDFHRYH